MATTYRFYKVGEVDVFLDTDASDDQKEFFVTDVRGLDPEEIRANFIPRIQVYNEGELLQYAQDKDVYLYSFDPVRGTRALRAEPVEYGGEFNGTDSKVEFDLTVDEMGEVTDSPLIVEAEVRFDNITGAGVVNYPILSVTTPDIGYVGVSAADINPALVQPYFFGGSFVSVNTPIGDQEWHYLKIETPINATKSITVDEDAPIVDGGSGPNVPDWNAVFGTDSVVLTIGLHLANNEYYKGSLKNIKLTLGDLLILDCPDPSTGINTTGYGNGTPTNVTQTT